MICPQARSLKRMRNGSTNVKLLRFSEAGAERGRAGSDRGRGGGKLAAGSMLIRTSPLISPANSLSPPRLHKACFRLRMVPCAPTSPLSSAGCRAWLPSRLAWAGMQMLRHDVIACGQSPFARRATRGPVFPVRSSDIPLSALRDVIGMCAPGERPVPEPPAAFQEPGHRNIPVGIAGVAGRPGHACTKHAFC